MWWTTDLSHTDLTVKFMPERLCHGFTEIVKVTHEKEVCSPLAAHRYNLISDLLHA